MKFKDEEKNFDKELSGNRSEEFMEQMLDLFKRTQNNKEFVALTKRSLLRK